MVQVRAPANAQRHEPTRMTWRTGLWLLVAAWLQAASLAWPLASLPGLAHGSASGFLQVLALASFFRLLKGVGTRQVFWRSWLFACAWLSSTFWWLFISMHRYGGLDAWLAALAVLALAGALGLYYALCLAAARRWTGAFDGLKSAAVLASSWTLAELMRGLWATPMLIRR
jgi:apolipoprotein N-acyltransferase